MTPEKFSETEEGKELIRKHTPIPWDSQYDLPQVIGVQRICDEAYKLGRKEAEKDLPAYWDDILKRNRKQAQAEMLEWFEKDIKEGIEEGAGVACGCVLTVFSDFIKERLAAKKKELMK